MGWWVGGLVGWLVCEVDLLGKKSTPGTNKDALEATLWMLGERSLGISREFPYVFSDPKCMFPKIVVPQNGW